MSQEIRTPHHRAKLTEEKVRYIRSSNEPGKVLAINLQVSEPTISAIRLRKRWSWSK